MSDYEQHPAVREMKRELAVARQTIRSLQDALAAEHKDDQKLREERDRAVDAANAAYEYDSATRQENRELAEKVNHNKLIAEAAQAKARLAERREQELTNALREIAAQSEQVGLRHSSEDWLLGLVYRMAHRARAALAPAVEEQR